MVRPVINVSNRATEFEIKTLKLSYDNQSNVRAPMVWEKPTANMYNYHYDIGGLYYQPMINYCMARENGGRRKVVEIPDRILSNFDKRSYRLKDVECDYDGFLTNCYQRRIKDTNSRSSNTAHSQIFLFLIINFESTVQMKECLILSKIPSLVSKEVPPQQEIST